MKFLVIALSVWGLLLVFAKRASDHPFAPLVVGIVVSLIVALLFNRNRREIKPSPTNAEGESGAETIDRMTKVLAIMAAVNEKSTAEIRKIEELNGVDMKRAVKLLEDRVEERVIALKKVGYGENAANERALFETLGVNRELSIEKWPILPEGEPGASDGAVDNEEAGNPQLIQDAPFDQGGPRTEKESTIGAPRRRGENVRGNGILRINYGNDDHVVTWEDLGEKSAKMAFTTMKSYFDVFKENIPNAAEMFYHNFELFLLDTLPFLITADIANLVGGKDITVSEDMLQSYCDGAVKVVMDMKDKNDSPSWRARCAYYVEEKIKYNCEMIFGNHGKPRENGTFMRLVKDWIQLLWIEFDLPPFENDEGLKQVVFGFFGLSSEVFGPSASATVVQTK